MTEVVSATDIVGDWEKNGSNGILDEVTVDDTVYDLRNLTACNYHAIQLDNDESLEEQLIESATIATQQLVKKIFECPIQPSDVGPVAVLPTEEVIRLPREKRVPDPKPETRWEKFAKEKNIKNKKRERMVFDEDTQEWKPRYGYKRANNGDLDIPIVEVKPGQDPNADPWAAARQEKKEKVSKNTKNQLKNVLRSKGVSFSAFKKGNFDPASVPGIPVDMNKAGAVGKRGKAGVHRALELVQHSTASMGRFDDMRHGEPERKIRGKKRSYADNFGIRGRENEIMKSQMRIVADKVDKKARGVTNSLAAYEGIIPDAPGDSFKKKKGKGQERSAVAKRLNGKGGKGKRK